MLPRSPGYFCIPATCFRRHKLRGYDIVPAVERLFQSFPLSSMGQALRKCGLSSFAWVGWPTSANLPQCVSVGRVYAAQRNPLLVSNNNGAIIFILCGAVGNRHGRFLRREESKRIAAPCVMLSSIRSGKGHLKLSTLWELLGRPGGFRCHLIHPTQGIL